MNIAPQGFRKDVRTGIELRTNGQPRLEVVLEVGSVADSAEVRASAPLLETTIGGGIIEGKTIVKIPVRQKLAARSGWSGVTFYNRRYKKGRGQITAYRIDSPELSCLRFLSARAADCVDVRQGECFRAAADEARAESEIAVRPGSGADLDDWAEPVAGGGAGPILESGEVCVSGALSTGQAGPQCANGSGNRLGAGVACKEVGSAGSGWIYGAMGLQQSLRTSIRLAAPYRLSDPVRVDNASTLNTFGTFTGPRGSFSDIGRRLKNLLVG